MAACLARGDSTETAARKAKTFVEQAILRSVPVGKGVGPVNPLANTLEEKERYLALQDVKEAVSILTYSPDFAKLIPEVGCNIGMAIPCARTYNEIAAVEGRIIRFREKAIPVGYVNFGASQHVARVILAALRENPEMRAAMNVKYSEEILEACREINPGISSFDRAEDPGDASTMEWGTSEAIRKYGGMPEVIYDKGAIGKEPMVRLLGKSASEVAKLAVELARRVK